MLKSRLTSKVLQLQPLGVNLIPHRRIYPLLLSEQDQTTSRCTTSPEYVRKQALAGHATASFQEVENAPKYLLVLRKEVTLRQGGQGARPSCWSEEGSLPSCHEFKFEHRWRRGMQDQFADTFYLFPLFPSSLVIMMSFDSRASYKIIIEEHKLSRGEFGCAAGTGSQQDKSEVIPVAAWREMSAM